MEGTPNSYDLWLRAVVEEASDDALAVPASPYLLPNSQYLDSDEDLTTSA